MSMVGAIDWDGDYNVITCNTKETKLYKLGHKDLDFELMQYTGLKDSNGKEIFQGDIIKMSNHGIAHVIFEEGGFKYIWLNKPWKYIRKKEFIYNAHLCEIIGNIYENKEEMEGFEI